MLIDNINLIRKKVKEAAPLIHCITNPISINQCANAVLAVGARPIMAENPKEVRNITKSAKAVLMNLGNITDVRKKAMLISARTAKKNNIPIVIDLVGVSCSKYRKAFAKKLIKTASPTVIKGNYSEVCAMYDSLYASSGVDADASLEIDVVRKAAIELSKECKAVVLVSGKRDMVATADRLIYVDNGSERLTYITGTGCMLGVLCASFLSAEKSMEAVVTACVTLGISGELSANAEGSGSYLIKLIDNLSVLSDESLNNLLRIEEKTNEEY